MKAPPVPKHGLHALTGCGDSGHTEEPFLQSYGSFGSYCLEMPIQRPLTDLNVSSATDANLSAHNVFGCLRYARDTETNSR